MREMEMKQKFCGMLAGLLLLILVTGCYDLPPAAPAASETPSEAAGFTDYADYEPHPADLLPLVPGINSDTLVAYFSRSANTYVPPDTDLDAVTSASMMISPDGALTGNAAQIAQWIADTTGGDLYAIQTVFTYPLDYDQTVAVGEGQDADGYLPELAGTLSDAAGYKYIYLVYPIWHYTLPAPVSSFLTNYSFSGSTIYAFATNAGSRFGNTIEKIRALQPQAEVYEGVSVPQQNVPEAEEEVTAKVEEFMQQNGQNNNTTAPPSEKKQMQIQIGSSTFTAELASTRAAEELAEMLAAAPMTITMTDYGSFEKVGELGTQLTADNTQITTQPGDIMLYNGSNIVMFYGSNTWAYTPLGTVTDLSGWTQALGSGSITAVLSLKE